MATTQIVKVRVGELTKYGFKVNNHYVNYSKQITESDKAKVVPGAELEAEFYIADSGKEYLNKVLTVALTSKPVEVAAPKVEPVKIVDTERAKKFTPKFQKKETESSTTMSKDEWAAKDRRISRQGCIQAAVNALGPSLSDTQEIFAKAVELADKMLGYVNQ